MVPDTVVLKKRFFLYNLTSGQTLRILAGVNMKLRTIIIILLIFAWPLYYLYERQLGAVSFLLLAIFFLVISIKELKKFNKKDN